MAGGRRRPWQAAGYVAGVWILLALLPTQSAVSSNPSILFAHGVRVHAWIGALMVASGVILLGSAGIVAAVERWTPPRAARRARLVAVVALTVLPIWGLTDRLAARAGPMGTLAAAVVLGTVAAVVVRRLRGGFAVFTAAFAVMALGSTLVLAPITSADSRSAVALTAADRPNVLWVVIDEAAAAALTDSDGQIRADFPALRSLQASATTYARTYTTYPFTARAIPAMMSARTDVSGLTGADETALEFDEGFLPIVAEQYEMLVPQADFFCRSYTCWAGDESAVQYAAGLVGDGIAIAANATIPSPLRAAFPSTANKVRDFWSGGSGLHDVGVDELLDHWQSAGGPRRPFFAVVHTYTAHGSWTVDTAGRSIMPKTLGLFATEDEDGRGDFAECVRTGTPCTPALADLQRWLYRNTLVQADRELGATLAELASRNLLDGTLVVVTSDHGAAIATNEQHRRPVSTRERADVAWVPLVVKYPGQHVPLVVSGPRSAGQIMPTVLRLAGFAALEPLPDLDDPAPDAATFAFPGNADLPPGRVPVSALARVVAGDLRPTTDPTSWAVEGLTDPSAWPLADADVRVLSGDSATAALVVHTTDPTCLRDPGGTAAVTVGASVVAPVFWESASDAAGALRGWALAPVADEADLEIRCPPPS